MERHVVDIVEFRTQRDVDENTFMQASKEVEERILQKQPGFLRREIVQSEDARWMDIEYWESNAALARAKKTLAREREYNLWKSMIDAGTIRERQMHQPEA
jgi:quinol monooxygenase YgiN